MSHSYIQATVLAKPAVLLTDPTQEYTLLRVKVRCQPMPALLRWAKPNCLASWGFYKICARGSRFRRKVRGVYAQRGSIRGV